MSNTLFQKTFYIFGFFFHLVFLFGEGAGFIAINSIWEPQGEIIGLPGGLCRGAQSRFAFEKPCFLHIFIKIRCEISCFSEHEHVQKTLLFK